MPRIRTARSPIRHFLRLLPLFVGVGAACAQYPYMDRGGYFEGVIKEKMIAGIQIELLSLSQFSPPEEKGKPAKEDSIHLAFVLPERFRQVDITVLGPELYLLNRVDRPFEPGLNIFSWDGRVVRGLGIPVERLWPKVMVDGSMLVPCSIQERVIERMPAPAEYRFLVRPDYSGTFSWLARTEADTLALSSWRSAEPQDEIWLIVPAGRRIESFDLILSIRVGNEPPGPVITQRYPVRIGRPE